MQENFVVHPSYESLKPSLRDFLNNFSSEGEFVIQGERNVIKKFSVGDTVFNVKKFKIPSFFQGLVYRFFRKSKAKRSYEYAQILMGKGINTPAPIAYLEIFSAGLRESFYVSKHVDYDFDFRVLIHNPKFEDREEILKQFAAFCYKMHESDINFLDHSPGNTLINKIAIQRYEFYLIDLNRMKFEVMNFDARMNNLRRLWLSKMMIRIMAKEYAQLYEKSLEETHQLLSKHSKAFQKKVNSKKLRRRNFK